MGRTPDLKRIAKEDFKKDDQALIEKLAYPINSFMEQTINVLSSNVDFQNLNQEIVQITTMVSSDIPVSQLQYKSGLKSKVQGMICVRVENLDTPGTPPVNTPFAVFAQQSTNIVAISAITGLSDDTNYRLSFLTIG